MHRKGRASMPLLLIHWAAAIVTLMWATSVYATESDSLRYYDLSDLVVVGMKEQVPLKTLPISATTISTAELEKHLIGGIKDFTGLIPNFIMTDRDTPHTSSVFVRGTGSLLNPSVVMYVDGVPHFLKSSLDIHLNDIEKIEFLRGPQGTLFGRNAAGGTIVIQTRSPFKHQGTTLDLKYGRFNEIEGRVSHLGKFNDHWGYALAGGYRYFGGYIPNTFLGKKADHSKSGSFNIKLEWRPSTRSVLRLTSNADFVRQGAFTYGIVDPETNYTNSVSLDHPSVYTRKIFDTGLQFTYHTDAFLLRSQLSFQHLNALYDVDQDGSEKDIFYVQQAEKQNLFAREVSIVGKQRGWYNWSFGAFGYLSQTDRTIDVYQTKREHIHRLHDERTWGVSVFHQSTFDLGEYLRLEAGLRYDYEKGRQDFTQMITPVGQTQGKEMHVYSELPFSQWTPKVSLQFFVTPEAHLYATVAKGYVTGGFNSMAEKEEQRTYGAESSWNYEIGAKGWVIPHKLYGEVALFAIDSQDKQLKKVIDGKGMNTYNAGRAMSAGVEASLTAHLTKAWEVNAAYGLTHATFTNYVYSKDKDYSGNFIPHIPRNTVSLSTQYTLPTQGSAVADDITFKMGYKGVGDIYWHESNDTKQDFYSLLDASIRARKGGLTYSIWGTNLTNTKYLGYYYTSQKKNFGKPGRPLMIGMGVSLTF